MKAMRGEMAGQEIGRHVAAGARMRDIGIRELLEWAFQRECAQLDFDEVGTVGGTGWRGHGTEYVMLERMRLGGMRIDGGGRSLPADDAEIVASTLAALPEARGGRRMAIWIAELARAGRAPDWMPDTRPRFYAAETHINRHGVCAKSQDSAYLGAGGWPAQPRRNRKGVIVHDPVKYCPVICRPNASEIAQTRRAYLRWWDALWELRETFRLDGRLSGWCVTRDMPLRCPWIKNS